MQQYRKMKFFAGAFQEFLQKKKKKIEASTFQNSFCCLVLLQVKNNIEGDLECCILLQFFNAFFNESKDKRK